MFNHSWSSLTLPHKFVLMDTFIECTLSEASPWNDIDTLYFDTPTTDDTTQPDSLSSPFQDFNLVDHLHHYLAVLPRKSQITPILPPGHLTAPRKPCRLGSPDINLLVLNLPDCHITLTGHILPQPRKLNLPSTILCSKRERLSRTNLQHCSSNQYHSIHQINGQTTPKRCRNRTRGAACKKKEPPLADFVTLSS